MKKIFVFVLLLVANIGRGQEEIPTVNNYSELSNNFRGELGSGNFVFDIPLFDLETVNPNFRLAGKLYYNAQGAATVFTARGMFHRKGFAVDFLPSVSRNIDEPNTLWDETYYKLNSADLPDNERPERINDLFEFDIFGLRGSFRLVYNSNNTINVQLVDCNNYVEIIPSYTMSSGPGDAKLITLNGFTLKDREGFIYQFDEPQESPTLQQPEPYSDFDGLPDLVLDDPDGYNLYKKSFLLGQIIDKYGRTVVDYIYKTYPYSIGGSFNYTPKLIDKVDILHRGKLVFGTSGSAVNDISIKDLNDVLISRVALLPGSSGINFYDATNQLEKKYTFSYYPGALPNSYINSQGNYLHSEACDPSITMNNELQNYTAGLLKTVVLPFKGKVDIEYEINTYDVGSQIPVLNNLVNYDYVEVPVDILLNGTYSFHFQGTQPGTREAYFIKFSSQLYTNPLILDEDGNPISFYPGVDISQGSDPAIIQFFPYENQCTYGEPMNKKDGNTTIVIHPRFTTHVSNVKVYKRTLKPVNERKSFLFGPSVRVKKITSTDHNNEVVNERVYSYTVPGDDNKSSGKTHDVLWDTRIRPEQISYKPLPVFYRYVGITETGKGKTVYELNSELYVNSEFAIAEAAYQPKNTWKYSDSGQLTEHVSNNFEYFIASDDPRAKERVKKIHSVIKTYEGAHFNEVNTEQVFDTVSMYLLENKITEVANAQTFEEAYTYQKLGNAFYRTGVEKTKNSAALNRSTYAYQQQGSTQAYDLKTVSVAKESRPLEVEREITLYDDYGNVLEYKTKDGMMVSQIWGYNDSKLVAELKNVSYSSISNATITSIRTNSNAAMYSESNLVGLLNGLRTTHTDGFITTWIYKPLIGITSVTDANGRKESYVYDNFNRLWRVFNHEGLIIKEYEYNIKN